MPRAAVLGQPVTHSLSPAIHRAGYDAAGLVGWCYDAVECDEADLAGTVGDLDAEWAGLSLTMPLKEVALTVADQVAPLPAALGAANTLVRLPDGGWQAENTDAPGIVQAVGGGAPPERMVVLGAGGTARAALGAASRLGCPRVVVVARRAAALTALDPVAASLGLRLAHRPWSAAVAEIADADLVVSTVPKGAADPLAAQAQWRRDAVLLDALYDPWPTPLATAAATAGCRVASGLDLLLAQAEAQFQLFTGATPPVGAMRAALRDAATARGLVGGIAVAGPAADDTAAGGAAADDTAAGRRAPQASQRRVTDFSL